MMAETFRFNDPPGTFRVFASDGSTAFDSRLQTLRVYQQGTLDLSGRTTTVTRVGNTFVNTANVTSVALNKIFAKAPYVRTASRKLGAPYADYQKASDRYYPPYLMFSSQADFYAAINGHYSTVSQTTLSLGNSDASASGVDGSRRFWYAVFDNPADQS